VTGLRRPRRVNARCGAAGSSAADPHQPFAAWQFECVFVHGPNRFTRLEHEAANCPEQSPVAIFVNLEPATAGVRDRDPPPIIHWPAPNGGRLGAPDSSRNDALHNRGT